MAWSQGKEKEWDPATYREEHFWESKYVDSQERWIKDFSPHYDLIGEYELDETQTLYRFERSDALKHELLPSASRFENVVIPRSKQVDK